MVILISCSDEYIKYLSSFTRKPAPEYVKKLFPQYRITQLIGSGGFAEVYIGTNSDGQGIAIKVPHFIMGETLDSSVLDKFSFESEIWKKLDHVNIVT